MSNILKEISTKNPVGSDQKYEDTYLAIESEIDKTMSASSAGDVDWRLISEHSTEILEEQSKDLKIASYWLYAQWKLSSWEGLESFLPLYIELISTYKIKLFPKSTKVKLRILEWLHENLSIAILKNIDDLEEKKFIELLNSLEALERIIFEVFEQEDLKVFAPLIRKLKKHNDEKQSQEKLNSEMKPVKEEKKQVIKNTEVVEDIKVDSYKIVGHKNLLKEKLSSIKNEEFLFDMTQTLGFIKLEEAFSKKEQLQREDFPSESELASLEKLKDTESYLEQIKVYVSKYPCWLEGQYLIINNKENEQSEEYQKFITTFKYKLISFINSDNSENFKNYQPENYFIINKELEKWVNLEKKSLIKNNRNNRYEEIFKDALSLIKTKNNEEAVLMLDHIKKDSKTAEESFLWCLKQVYLAFEIDNKNMAVALLQDLNREIETFNLEKWQPDLAIEVYVLLLKPSINKILNLETKELIYGKLCRLSPQEAMKISFL